MQQGKRSSVKEKIWAGISNGRLWLLEENRCENYIPKDARCTWKIVWGLVWRTKKNKHDQKINIEPERIWFSQISLLYT